MKTQFYHTRGDPEDNYNDLTIPLHINGTGYSNKTIVDPPLARSQSYWRLQLTDYMSPSCMDPMIVTPGQFILQRADEPYQFWLGKQGVRIGFYWIHFTGNCVESLIEESRLIPGKIYTLQETQMKVVQRDFDKLFRELLLREQGYQNIAASLLTNIIIHLGRFVLEDSPENTKSRLRVQLKQSAIYIHNHYTEDITVIQLADMEQLSERRYRSLFHEAFDMPPGEYIIHLRIAYACELLSTTDLSVTQIAESCGYEDPLYFSRLFRKKTGMPPLAYRKGEKTV